MSAPLRLYYHPLSSFCWKALIALYEHAVPFEPVLVDLGDAASRAALTALWPLGRFPVLHDTARGEVVPESSILIEYLDHHHAGATRLIPHDADAAREQRLRDRLFDHLNQTMQKIVTDRLRPAEARDGFGVEQARAQLRTTCAVIERDLPGKTWAAGEHFGLADCAAFPALYYADRVQPLHAEFPLTAAYLARLHARPSVARVFREAQPYLHLFPL